MAQITLHEEIVAILRDAEKPMQLSDIAAAVNHRRNYMRRDGKPVPSSQIGARVHNYPKLFDKIDSLVSLKGQISLVSNNFTPVVRPGEPRDSDFEEALLNANDIRGAGFESIGTLADLWVNGLPSSGKLSSCGVYAILTPEAYEADFYSPSDVERRGNVIRPRGIDYLRGKWIDGVEAVYFGLAGSRSPRSLRKRLTDLLNHGSGRITDRGPHKGGEILWQLVGYERFELWVKTTAGPPAPRNLEASLIRAFIKAKGKLPFANRQS